MQDRLEKLEEVADQMGLDAGELAKSLASDMSQMQMHARRHKQGCVQRTLDMLKEEAGLPADADTAEALLAFIDKHGTLCSLIGEAAAQFAYDLGERASKYDLRYTDHHEGKVIEGERLVEVADESPLAGLRKAADKMIAEADGRIALIVPVITALVGGDLTKDDAADRLWELDVTLSELQMALEEADLDGAPTDGELLEMMRVHGRRETVGEQLRRLRKEAGLSQQDAAEAAGLSQGRLSEYERGERSPSADVLERMAKVVGPITIWTQEAPIPTPAETRRMWSEGNNDGDGYPVGDDDGDVNELAIGELLRPAESTDDVALYRVDGRLVGVADANGPWAVDL